MNISSIVNSLKSLFNGSFKIDEALPSLLLLCVAMRRPGTSAMNCTSNIIQDDQKAGIPYGVNPDGTPNLINRFVYNITNNIFKEINERGVGNGVIGPGTLNIVVTGSNAGGPFVAHGTNPQPIMFKSLFS